MGGQAGDYQATIEKLYALYKEKGFLKEEDALAVMTEDGISLVGINRVTDRLIALGVVFADDSVADDDEDYDRTRTDYEDIFSEVLDISPGLQMLVNYIRSIKPPQNREWRSLITQMNSGNEYAFNRLFDMYLRVVVRMALRFSKESGYELDDAIQEGCMGLIKAIQQYDSSRHGNLGSYFPFWIQQYIGRAVTDKGRVIRLPVHICERIQKIKKIQFTLSERKGCDPAYAEIASMAETSVETVIVLLQMAQEICSLESILDDEDCNKEIDERYYIQPFEEEIDNNSLRQVVHNVLTTLTDREQQVMSLRYGLADGRDQTLEQVGVAFHVTRERIRQIEMKAFRKLRHPSRARKFKDFICVNTVRYAPISM
jgi:RNA polymerase sigma factor, sigma-70 family